MINEVVDVFKGRFLEVGIEVKSYAEVTQGLQKVCNVDERNQILLLDTGDTLDAARLDHILKKADRDPQRSAQLRIFLFDKTCMEEKPDKIFQSRIVRKVPSFTLSDFPKLVPLYETHSNSSIIERAAWYFNTEKESLGILMDSKKKYEDVRNAFIQSKELLYSFQNFSSGTKVTVDNLMLHYIVSYRKVEKFNYHYKSYLQKYEEVLTSFDSDVENLREFDIDGSLADRKISDFIDFDKLYQWRGNCEDSHKKIDSRVKLIYQTLEDIKRRVEAQEESAKTEIPPEFEKAVTVIENLLEKELRSSLQTVFNSYINIRKNLEKCIRSNFATEDVNSLKAAKEELDGNSYSRYVMTASDVTDKVTNWKIKMEKLNKWAIKELFEVLRNVGSLETDIKFKVKKKTDFMMDILTQQSKSLRYVQLPRMFPVAYKNAVQEMERRRGFKTEFEKILRHMHELCKTESEKRAKFLTSFGDFIPQDFCPELKEPPPALSVQNCQFSADHELITENVSLKKKLADLDAKYQDLIKTKEEYDVTNQKLHNDYQNKFNQWKTDFENKLLTVSTYGDDKRSDTGESSPTKLTDQNSNSPNNDLRFISTFGSNSIDVKNQQQQEMDRLREVEQLAREEVYEMERRKDEMLSKLDSLKEGVREIERDHDKHESCREQWQERTTRIAEEVSRLEKETTRIQGDRDVLAGSLATLREEIKSMEQEESDLKKRSLRIEDLKKLEQEELVTEKTLVEKLEDLKVHSKILNDDYENLCIQIGNIDHEKVAKETALKEMQDQASSLEIKRSKCELEIKEMGEFIKSLMQVKEETGKRIEDLQEGMSEAEVIASTIIKVHQEEMKTLREENDQGRIRCMELEEKCALLESAQKGEKQPFELEIKAKEEEVDVLKTRLRSLEDYYSPQLQACKLSLSKLSGHSPVNSHI